MTLLLFHTVLYTTVSLGSLCIIFTQIHKFLQAKGKDNRTTLLQPTPEGGVTEVLLNGFLGMDKSVTTLNDWLCINTHIYV